MNGQDISQSGRVRSLSRFFLQSIARIRAVQYHFIVAVNANRGTYLPI